MNVQEMQQRYQANLHAMQSGVAIDQSRGSQCGSPKHLRVGVNAAMVDHAALVQLLLKKGVITEEEFWQSMMDASQAEVDRYEAMLTKSVGIKVTLA